jgi:lipopolysaccharide biosynthesis protein
MTEISNAFAEIPADASALVRTIAFYLPQFHRVKENDEWWGEGFTEWTNVTRAKPLFPGHDQPRKPTALGYYDLTDPDARQRQAELARAHGIHGFCYYHYWFSAGRRLLERPFHEVLTSGRPDFPFCLCWANENWTRAWDGKTNRVLMEQNYSEEDAVKFAEDLVPAFRDPRYIRVNGKPLLVVYRPRRIPDPKKYISIWQDVWSRHGIGEAYVCGVLAFGETNPIELGCSAAVEFPPHKGLIDKMPLVSPESIGVDGFEGKFFDYKEWVAQRMSAIEPGYTLFRTVMLAWDNTARRGNKGTSFLNCDVATYEAWLLFAVEMTRRANVGDERIVFINAWNEWAEGTYLEPDESRGYDFLNATKAVIEGRCHPDRHLQQAFDQIYHIKQRHAEVAAKYASLLNEFAFFKKSYAWRLAKPFFSVERHLRKKP